MNNHITELKDLAMYDQWSHGAFGESERHSPSLGHKRSLV